MRNPFATGSACVVALALLCACSSTDTAIKDTVIFHYQHVANVHQIHFAAPVTVARRPYPFNFVIPVDSQGFWAIFVICSLDVAGHALGSFNYNVDNFQVKYGEQTFGPLQPYTLRYEDSADLNTPPDTEVVVAAIAAELQEGPSRQLFPNAFYGSLNYRVALFIPKALSGYAGEQLTLRYAGQPSLLLGNGHPPSDIPVAGGNAGGVAATCLP